jgi:hypothetical protein
MDQPPPTPSSYIFEDDSKSGRQLKSLRAAWGKPVDRWRDMSLVAMVHDMKPVTGPMVDDRTWADLAMDEVFAAMDRTVSMPGGQSLYHQLRTYEFNADVLRERSRQQEIFRRNAGIREQIQLAMSRLKHGGAAYVGPLLLGSMPERPAFAWVLQLLSVATPACLVAMLFVHPLIMAAVALALINAAIYYTYGQRISPHFVGFSQLNSLLAVAKELGAQRNEHRLPQLETLSRHSALVTRLHRRLGWLVADRTALPELVAALYAYLNLICLADIAVFLGSTRILREHREALLEVFDAVGTLDASIAVASYTTGLITFTTPEFESGRRIAIEGAYHPLIPNAVANDLTLAERSALIAGPNMAGKTAFIRTIGINLILAQTVHLCLARRAVVPTAEVRSAIRREDSLSEGESYFFTEVKQLLDFTRAPSGGRPQVFLIDEIFRGTNTMERIAISTSVLRHLARAHIAFATTHDLELQDLLVGDYEMFHFSDRVADGHYGFDYHLSPGPVRSRNAIKLLELSGYAPSIIAEAQSVVELLNRTMGIRDSGKSAAG